MSEAEKQEGAVDSRTTYRPIYEEASAPRDIRRDMRAAIDGDSAEEKAAPIEDLPEDVQNTLNAVDEELGRLRRALDGGRRAGDEHPDGEKGAGEKEQDCEEDGGQAAFSAVHGGLRVPAECG